MPTQSSSSIVSRLAVVASIAALSLSAAVAAQASNWTGSGTDANWSTAENWDVAVDESSGVAAFPYGTSGDSVVDKDYTLSSLSFLNGADAIRLSVAEGKTLSAGDRVRIASEDYSTGVVEVVSGKINMTGDGLYIARLAGIWYYTDAWRVHENAVGTLRILGGEITDAGSPSIALGRASRGLIDMRGGSFTFANEMFLGLDTDGRGEGRLELTGGAITEKVEFGGGNSADTTYILCGYATNMWIGGWSCEADGTVKPGTDIESHLSQLDQNNNEKSLKVILGQRLENPAPSEGLLGETLVFTNALTTAETEAVRLYLKAKWFDPKNPMPAFDSLVVNAEIDLGGTTRTFEKLSGSGSFVDGTVVLTGDLVVTVNSDGKVVAPSFDKLVLGENARLVVNGAKNLPKSEMLEILLFASIDREFSSVVGDRSTRVMVRYADDHIDARRDAGMRISLR